MSYNFLKVSGSRFRNIIGSDNYDTNWNNFVNYLQEQSASGAINDLSGSQLTEAESTLQEWEASPSSFSWFGDWISQSSGSLF